MTARTGKQRHARRAALTFFTRVLRGVPPNLGVWLSERSADGVWCDVEVVTDPELAADLATTLDASGSDAYFSAALFPIAAERRRSQECAGLACVWLDLDIAGSPQRNSTSKAHGAPSRRAAIDVANAVLPPSLVVGSGGGVHAYHLLNQPQVFEHDREREQAAHLVKRWQELHRRHADWHIDATHDLARVLRIPGTKNRKIDEARPVSSIKVRTTRRPRYSRTLLDSLTANIIDDDQLADRAKLRDIAVLPEERLAALRRSPGFERVWSGQQTFESDSERDFALMKESLLVRATDEEAAGVVALKREDGKGFRRTYLERTLARARREVDAQAAASAVPRDWMRSAADLMRRPDPGPTPFVIDKLIVENSICAIHGPYKVGKTWLVLELVLALVGARSALGQFSAPKSNRVLAIFEESGEAALHRRLLALCDGYGLAHQDKAFASLYYAANARVQLLDPTWQDELIRRAREADIDVIVLDPFARITGDADENSKKEMAPVLTFVRRLRDESGATVIFVHHTGHEATARMRGTSDLEAYWESKLAITGKPMSNGPFTLTASHREAEGSNVASYQIVGSTEDQRVRLELVAGSSPGDRDAEQRDAILAWIASNPGHTNREIVDAHHRGRGNVAQDLEALANEGLLQRRKNGRRKEWHATDKGSTPGTSKRAGAHPGTTEPEDADSPTDTDDSHARMSGGQIGADRAVDESARVPRRLKGGGTGARRTSRKEDAS